MVKMTEEELIASILKKEPPNTKVKKVVKGEYTYYQTNDINIDSAARIIKKYIY